MNQQRSRKVLIGVGTLAAVLLASPFVLGQFNARQELAGKIRIYEQQTPAPHKAVFECLIKTRSGGLALQVSSTDHYFDPARDVAVRIEDRGDLRIVRVWAAQGNRLRPGELAQLDTCLPNPGRAGPAL